MDLTTAHPYGEESLFDFEQEINDQYAAQYDEDMIFDDYSSGIDAESYDP
jgi:hypothetical protein